MEFIKCEKILEAKCFIATCYYFQDSLDRLISVSILIFYILGWTEYAIMKINESSDRYREILKNWNQFKIIKINKNVWEWMKTKKMIMIIRENNNWIFIKINWKWEYSIAQRNGENWNRNGINNWIEKKDEILSVRKYWREITKLTLIYYKYEINTNTNNFKEIQKLRTNTSGSNILVYTLFLFCGHWIYLK